MTTVVVIAALLCGNSNADQRPNILLVMTDDLRDAGLEQNTLVIFLSDNGGDYSNGSIKTDESQIPSNRTARLVKAWQDFAAESNVPNANRPISDVQHGWGWHRLTRICPSLKSLYPQGGSTVDSTAIRLRLAFGKSVDFSDTVEKYIALYDVSDESIPVWRADPHESHTSQGRQTVVFDDISVLIPNHHYAIRWDAGFIKIGKRSVGTLNDGAYWWRFRTPNRSDTPSTESR